MSKQTPRGRLKTFAQDRRGWIPFALIGVLLLVVSMSLIVSLEIRDDPEPEIDEDLTFDRAEASVQTELRMAVEDAVLLAGDAPVTDPSDNGLGNALEETNLEETIKSTEGVESGADFEDLDEATASDHVFRNYVSLLIYQQAQERIDGTSQEIRGVESTVSLDELTTENAEDKIESVDLRIGHEEEDLAVGTIGVTLKDVELTIERDGETIGTQSADIDATVATTVFELHERTQEYQQQLDMGFIEGIGENGVHGFGQQFALRLYPVAYAKSGIKWIKPTIFEEITSNRQSEVLANHAKYSVQESAFGTSDPQSSQEMKIATLCLAVSVGSDIIASQLESVGEEGDEEEYNESFEDGMGEVMDELLDEDSEIDGSEITQKIVDGVDLKKMFKDGIDSDSVERLICQGIRVAFDDDEDIDIDLSIWELLSGMDTEDSVEQEKTEIGMEGPAGLAYREVTEDVDAPNDLELDELLPTQFEENEEGDLVYTNESGEEVKVDESALKGVGPDDSMGDFYEDNAVEEAIDGSPSIESDIIEDVYSVEISSDDPDTSFDDAKELGDVGPPDEEEDWELNHSISTESHGNPDIDVDTFESLYDQRVPDAEEDFYRFEVSVDQDITIEEAWDKEKCTNKVNGTCESWKTVTEELPTHSDEISVEIDVVISGEYSPGIDAQHADERPLEHAYESGGSAGPEEDPANFEGVPEQALADTVPVLAEEDLSPGPQNDLGDTLKSNIEGALGDERLDEGDVESQVYSSPPSSYKPGSQILGSSLLAEEIDVEWWLERELERMVYNNISDITHEGYPDESLLGNDSISVDSVEVNMTEFVTTEEESPLGGLSANLEAKEDGIIYQDVAGSNDNYETVHDLARAEVYYQFVEKTDEHIDTVSDVHENMHDDGGLLSGVGNFFGGAGDTLEDLFKPFTDFKDRALKTLSSGESGESVEQAAPQEEGEEEILEEVTFEIEGSPTYLSLDSDDGDSVSAIREAGDGRFGGIDTTNPLDGEEKIEGTDHSTMYAGYTNPLPYPGVPLIPVFHAVQFSLWNVEVGGEYPRFEVSGTADSVGSTNTYVRENVTVAVDINGESEEVGSVEPLNFDSRTIVGVIMPPGGVGDGGPSAWTSLDGLANTVAGCSETYRYTGPQYEDVDKALLKLLDSNVEEHDIPPDLKNIIKKPIDSVNNNIPVLEPVPSFNDLDFENNVLVDQAGCIYAQLQAILEDIGEFFD